MARRPDSILGLALHYASLRLQRPSTRARAVALAGLAGAALTAVAAGVALRAVARCPGACAGPCARRVPTNSTRAVRAAQTTQTAVRCASLVLRPDGAPLRQCLPSWAWSAMLPAGIDSLVRPRDGQSLSLLPALASNGDGYGLAYTVLTERSADVYFQRLSAGGDRVGVAVKVSASGEGESAVLPSIAWTGAGYAIAWTGLKGEDQLDVHLARVDPAGTLQGAAQQVSSSREMDLGARVAFSNARIAVGWLRFNGQDQMSARFRFFDGAGASVGSEVAVNDVLITGIPSLSATAQGFAFGYSTFDVRRAQSVLTLRRMGPEGQGASALALNAERKVNGSVAMASDGEAFNLVWEDGMYEQETNTLAFARAAGSRVEVRRAALTNGRAADVQPAAATASDGRTGVAWTHVDARSGRPAVQFARVGRDGKLVGQPLRMTGAGSDGLFPSVAWGGREFLVAWTDVRGDRATIALGRVSPDGGRPADAR
jgi:hypothetical protein